MSTVPIKRGNTLDLPMQVTKDGAAFSLSGKTLIYLLKERTTDEDAAAVLTFNAGDGLTVTNAENGNFTLDATAEEMSLPRNYYYGAVQIRDNATGSILELPENAPADVWEVTGQSIFSTA